MARLADEPTDIDPRPHESEIAALDVRVAELEARLAEVLIDLTTLTERCDALDRTVGNQPR